ncbi:MAG TPA: hypothetical protein VHG91_05285 [Longimicrobium sp.]|nr:hypothetical protein [Longimicrobium sp.]
MREHEYAARLTWTGNLGELTRRMAEAGVNIEIRYSDHTPRLVLVVDDHAKGRAVAEAWRRERAAAALP